MSLMDRLLYPYMAPKDDDGSDLSGEESVLAKLRGDDIEDLPEETDEEREAREAAEAATKAEEDEKVVKGKKKEVTKEEDKDEEEEEVVEEEEEPAAKKVAATIPKARFDELNRKSKETIAAQAKQIDALTKQAKIETAVEDVKKTETAIANLEKEAKQLFADGKNDEAIAKLGDVRLLERALIISAAKFESDSARAIAVEQVRLDMLVVKLEEEFPQIDPDSDDYDQDLVDEVMELRGAFEKTGKSSSESLAKAVKYVFADKVAKVDEEEKEEKEDKEEKEEKKPVKAKEADRKKAAVTRNAKDAKKLPAKTGDLGVDSDKKGGGVNTDNVDDMSEEEFEALPESTKARMRGDTLEA